MEESNFNLEEQKKRGEEISNLADKLTRVNRQIEHVEYSIECKDRAKDIKIKDYCSNIICQTYGYSEIPYMVILILCKSSLEEAKEKLEDEISKL